MPSFLPTLLLLPILGAAVLAGRATAGSGISDLEAEIARLGLDRAEIRIGVQVVMEGRGVLLDREPAVSRSAASAIKTAVALDLLGSHNRQLDEVPQGLESLLQPGVHPAMAGFTVAELSRCRGVLAGKTYRELVRIMMGRTSATNETYNAACNVIMIKLGGPEAITRRLHDLDPAFQGIVIDRYMQHWNGDGDNRATPEALVALYRMTASGTVPGLGPAEVDELRDLLFDPEVRGGRVFEKEGTLFPRPMVRVRAGYVERPEGRLVYAVMGEVLDTGTTPSADLFLRLMNGVDAVAVHCRSLSLARTR
jgi:hypothetical protein